jgi:hypothetical protein
MPGNTDTGLADVSADTDLLKALGTGFDISAAGGAGGGGGTCLARGGGGGGAALGTNSR